MEDSQKEKHVVKAAEVPWGIRGGSIEAPPVRHMISMVPRPSAVRSTIRARD